MVGSVNFVDCFQIDLVSKILAFLDDSADLIRASAVSRSWRHFVISNRLSKKLCLRKVPPLASITCVIEENDGILKISDDVVSRNPINLETLEREHKIYSSLLQILATPITCPKECIALPFGVSSTDRDPAENIINTLDPVDRRPWGYWSSVGQSDPNVPEHILYLLKSPTCIVTEINIRPFEVFWEPGCPVYSAKFVRFRMGRPKSLADLAEISGTQLRPSQKPCLDKYVWTYTSPVFPMAQESRLQKFKLPEPTICIGGFLHIELLGRAQREEIDGLFYICIGHVSVMGHTLEPAFNFEMLPSGELLLKHCPYALEEVIQSFSNDGLQPPSGPISTMCRLRLLRDLIPVEIAEEILDLDHFPGDAFVAERLHGPVLASATLGSSRCWVAQLNRDDFPTIIFPRVQFDLFWISHRNIIEVISKMEIGINLVDSFQNDVVCKIMSYLDDSADLIRATVVSRSWCHFVISNRLCIKICCKKVTALESIARLVEENDGIVKMLDEVVLRNPTNWETLEKEHKIYSSLLRVLGKPIKYHRECMALTVGVLSSTDCDPAETLLNISDPYDRCPFGYVSNKPNVLEHIIYQLKTPTCIVKEILILPSVGGHFSSLLDGASFNWRHRLPIYLGKSIHFRMGHPKSVVDLVEMGGTHVRPSQQPSLNNYVWTYTSPVFSMNPDSNMHLFKLPEPTICMGGFLHIEMLDRNQREENHGNLYICLGKVSVLGVPLEPAFKLEMFASGALKLSNIILTLYEMLQHCPCALRDVLGSISSWF